MKTFELVTITQADLSLPLPVRGLFTTRTSHNAAVVRGTAAGLEVDFQQVFHTGVAEAFLREAWEGEKRQCLEILFIHTQDSDRVSAELFTKLSALEPGRWQIGWDPTGCRRVWSEWQTNLLSGELLQLVDQLDWPATP